MIGRGFLTIRCDGRRVVGEELRQCQASEVVEVPSLPRGALIAYLHERLGARWEIWMDEHAYCRDCAGSRAVPGGQRR